MPDYTSQADLEAQFGPEQVRRVFSDDGLTVSSAALAAAIARASRVVDSVLARAWPDAVTRATVAGDEGVKAIASTLAMHYGYQRRPEMRSDASPEGPLAKDADRALADLDRIAKGELRPEVADGGTNQNVVGRLTTPQTPQFMFAPSRGRPRPGGY